MAKELPYFKFEPSEWLEGQIQICSDTTIVCFTNLLSGYWLKLGCISYAFALHKYCRKDESVLNELIENGIISINDDSIVIKFLDEQLNEFQKTSEKRRSAANTRWKNASALQTGSKSNAIKGDKIKGEKKIKETIVYPKEVYMCYDHCIKYFPENVLPKDHNKKNKWLDTIDKLYRIDSVPYEKIIEIVKGTRASDFWAKNFLSLTKLRKKNNDDVMYIVVFNENLKSKPNGKQKSGVGYTDEEILEAVRQQNNDN
jgi:hypothetical protein